MLKRKRNDNDIDNEEENTNNKQIYINNNQIYYYSDVNSESILELIKSIDECKKYVLSNSNDMDDMLPIYLHICSDGGDVYPALAVIDHILNSKIKIITVCEGCVASAGVLISLAGHERYIRNHGYMLIHEIRSSCWGKYQECKDDMTNNNVLMRDLKKYMNKRCKNKLLKQNIDTLLERDIIWDSATCLKYGLITKII